jgi:hypothetical protein
MITPGEIDRIADLLNAGDVDSATRLALTDSEDPNGLGPFSPEQFVLQLESVGFELAAHFLGVGFWIGTKRGFQTTPGYVRLNRWLCEAGDERGNVVAVHEFLRQRQRLNSLT